MATTNIELDKAKFWSRVKVLNRDKCWEYSGPDQGGGYGQFRYPSGSPVPVLAHRLAWTLINGTDPGDNVVMHRCDNRRCVNPHHLVLGSQMENIHDMINKGRQVKNKGLPGGSNPSAKLTDEQAIKAKADVRAGVDRRLVASRLGVSKASIDRLMQGKSWKHLP